MTEKFKGRAAYECAIGDEPFTFGPYELGGQTIRISARAMAAEVWSRLVKAGLAEEQREPGEYHVKLYPEPESCDWVIRYWTGAEWVRYRESTTALCAPAIIGPRIEPPKD